MTSQLIAEHHHGWYAARILYTIHQQRGEPNWRYLTYEEKVAWHDLAALGMGLGWVPRLPLDLWGGGSIT